MLQVHIIHVAVGPISLVLLTIALVIFADMAPLKGKCMAFCIYQLLSINSAINSAY